ncbi:MAG: CocE/NonD family hydrolase [Candidatus Nanopelagicales bacterium]
MHAQIEMSDGARLSVTLFLPDAQPAPCILEALPYRKDDMTAGWRPEYERFAHEFGFAVARVDVRGTGSSGGLATDEYPQVEQRDLAEVIAWLATQPWCTGSVGMFGTSYGGFNSFQLACERPAHLNAIIPIYATDDRYTDDVHQMGGARKWLDIVDYCHYMAPMNLLPPVPEIWGGTWREEWLHRIEHHEPWLLTWLAHPRDDEYWRHGSVRPDYDRINIPTMIIAGWADGYRNTSFRTVAAINAPTRLLAGPWAHAAPSSSAPGPRIDHVAEMAAFFDEHLRGGVSSWAQPHTWFCRFSHAPDPVLDTVPGVWRSDTWPSTRSHVREIPLTDQPAHTVRPDVGTAAWISCAGHLPYGQPDDQRFDDAASLTWDIPVDSPVEIAGNAHVRAHVAATCPHPIIAVRLCDVAPDGTSTLVTRGTLLIGPDGDVDVELEATAWQWQAGRTLRVSIAGSDWPNVVAPGGPGTLTLHGATLMLPIYDPDPTLPIPVFAPGDPGSSESTDGITWSIERDVARHITRCSVGSESTYDTPYGSASESYAGEVSVDTRTFEQHAHSEVEFTLRFPEVTATAHSVMDIVAVGPTYDVTITIIVREGDEIVTQQLWQRSFPRA